MTRIQALPVLAGLLLPCLAFGGPPAGALPAGKIKLVGKYARVQLKEGQKAKTYFALPASGRMTIKAGGPASLVLLARTRGGAATAFDLQLDGQRAGQVTLNLDNKVTRGFFVPIPAGSHDLVIAASEPVVLRPVRVQRKPKAGEAVVAWRESSRDEAVASAAAIAEPRPNAPSDTPPAEAAKVAGPASAKAPIAKAAPPAVAGDTETPSETAPSTNLLKPGEPKTLMVLEVKAVGVDESTTKPLASALATRLSSYEQLQVTSLDDARAMLSHEESRALMECRDSSSCIARIASSLKTDWAVAGSLGRVGKSYSLNLSLLDVKAAATLSKANATFDSLDEAPAAIETLVARLLGEEAGGEKRFRLAQGQKVSLAVMNLKAEGVAAELAGNLTQILSVELKRIEGTSVISRDDVTAMLQLEENKMMLGCDDASCMAEIGGALGVDKLVVGSVGKLAQSYVTTLRLIDVRNARVDGRVTETFRGEEEQLIRAVRHAGRRLFGIAPEEGGRLAVSANQEGAELHLDGDLLGTLPGPPAEVDKPGRHLLRVSKSGYFDWQSEVYIDPGETTAIWSKLEARPESWYQKWWVWTVVGVVVVGGATTAGILLAPDQKPGRGEVILP